MSTPLPDYYRLLEVDTHASIEVIEKAYRVLAMRHHPDSSTGAADSDTMALLNTAMEVMRSPEQRARYDRERARVREGSHAPNGVGRQPSSQGHARPSDWSRPTPASAAGSSEGFDPGAGASNFGCSAGQEAAAPDTEERPDSTPDRKGIRSLGVNGAGILVTLALAGALMGWAIGPLMRQGSAQEDVDSMLHRPDGTVVFEAEHSYDPEYQPVVAWLGEWERNGWVEPSLADAAPVPLLSVAGFRDELRNGHVLYLSDASIDVAAPDWDQLQGPLMRALGHVDGTGSMPTIVARDSQGGLDVSYSYETLDDSGSVIVCQGRVIAVYEGERYPGSDLPPWTLVLVTVEGI